MWYQVVLDLIVEYQAGIPPLMKPLSRNTSDAIDFGHVITQHMAKLHTTEGTIYLVTDRALYSERISTSWPACRASGSPGAHPP